MHTNADFLRDLWEWALQRLMEMEVESQVGAGFHERGDGRTNHRNGYRSRILETRAGTMNLPIPKLRTGSYYPSFLEPRRRSEQALVAVIQEAYIQGVSTRKVDNLVQAMGMNGISKSQVSRFCGELYKKVRVFLERPIAGKWPYLWLDATYVKSREKGHVVNRAVVMAVGVNSHGRRDILGMSAGPAETEGFWTDFLRSLARRGLEGVKLIVSDAPGEERPSDHHRGDDIQLHRVTLPGVARMSFFRITGPITRVVSDRSCASLFELFE